MLQTLAIIAACICVVGLLVVFAGPSLLGAFFRKADEWAEIVESMKDEK